MVENVVPAVKSLLGDGRTPTPVASNTSASPTTGATSPTQLAAVVQLSSAPPPSHVRVVGALTTNALLEPREPAAPGTASVSVAALPGPSRIVPPLSASDVVDT